MQRRKRNRLFCWSTPSIHRFETSILIQTKKNTSIYEYNLRVHTKLTESEPQNRIVKTQHTLSEQPCKGALALQKILERKQNLEENQKKKKRKDRRDDNFSNLIEHRKIWWLCWRQEDWTSFVKHKEKQMFKIQFIREAEGKLRLSLCGICHTATRSHLHQKDINTETAL